MSDAVIETRGLTRDFGGTRAVNAVDLRIDPGMIYGFLGPNGCGKTTLMRMLTGLLTPTAGTARVLGTDLPGNAEGLKRQIGYMTQTFSHYRDLTVRENLDFAATVYGYPRKKKKGRIEELLARYELEGQIDQLSGSMSGGQRQKMALAAAVLHHPKLLFLDEPTSAVDPESRRVFWEALFDLIDDGTSIIVTTHFMDEAERCHRIAILEYGIKRIDGSPPELMAGLKARVVQVEGSNLREAKRLLDKASEILSAAQIGARLRVMVRPDVSDPEGTVRRIAKLTGDNRVTATPPNLEDVFVSATTGEAT